MSAVRVRAASVATCLVVLAGCAGSPSQRPPSDVAVFEAAAPAPPTDVAYERALQERVANGLRQKHLADAALGAELLTVLRPGSGDYRDSLNDIRRQIEAGVAARLARADQAARRGDLDAATPLYLSVLALQPTHEVAADALRAIERERNKRYYLGKFSRVTLTRRVRPEPELPASAAVDESGLAARNELEHAALLTGDGEFDAAIALLEQRLAAGHLEPATRRLLADVYYRKAEALWPSDPTGAIEALGSSTRADPSQPRAARRLAQLLQWKRRAPPSPGGTTPRDPPTSTRPASP